MNIMINGDSIRVCSLISLFLLSVSLIAVAGCRMTAPSHKIEDTVHDSDDLAVNIQQVRLRIRALVVPLSGAIVESADRIIIGTTDRAVRREALLWKIEAVPALREALFRPNPFVAIMDSWVLIRQMTEYFEQGRGQDFLGDADTIAVTTCRYLESQIESIAASMIFSGNVADVLDFARKWAAEHPIRDSIAGRESTMSLVTERDIQETFSTPEVVASLVVTLDDLSRRLDIYSGQLLDQSRWQAELLALDLGKEYQIEKAIPLAEKAVQSAENITGTVNRLGPSLEAALEAVGSASEVVSKERADVIKTLKQELDRTISFIQDERIAALTHLTKQLQTEMLELHQIIIEERKALVVDMEQTSLKVVDYAFLRATQLAVAILIILFVGALVLIFGIRRLFVTHT